MIPMIKIDLQGEYCDGCPCFEAETIRATAYENDEGLVTETKIVCSNRKICEHFETYLRKKLEERAQ